MGGKELYRISLEIKVFFFFYSENDIVVRRVIDDSAKFESSAFNYSGSAAEQGAEENTFRVRQTMTTVEKLVDARTVSLAVIRVSGEPV